MVVSSGIRHPQRSRINDLYEVKSKIGIPKDYYVSLGKRMKELSSMLNGIMKLHTPSSKDSIIVFDIDDTILHSEDILVRPITEMKKIWDTLQNKGYTICLVTARKEKTRQITMEELHSNGFTGYADLILRPNTTTECVCYYKEKARHELEQKHKKNILLNVGDQETDLLGGHFILGFKMPHKSKSDCHHMLIEACHDQRTI